MPDRSDADAAPRAASPTRSLADPRLVPFLPLLYVAWADGELSAGEIAEICRRVEGADGLDGGCRALLGGWLDPERPPSAGELAALLAALRRSCRELPGAERRSLHDLGLELARHAGTEPGATERAALAILEAALGVPGAEATRGLLATAPPVRPLPEVEPAFDVAALTRLLDGRRHELRRELRQVLTEPPFVRPAETLARDAYRALVLEWCRELARRGYGTLGLPAEHGGGGDTLGFIAAFETIAYFDLSLLVKFGVQFGLFAGSIHQLGTTHHHRRYLPPAGRLELPGCFAMSETGHGSNVDDLETVARYDREGDEFVVHTPHRRARKDYIGNAARDGRLATVFAQLEIDGHSHGVHALLVPIRDAAGAPMPGVEIEDCGEKMGLNGVDNGRLLFDQVRVPRANLLDRFARVTPEGGYESPIASPAKRFFTMLGTLVGGRVSVAAAALSTARAALAIAVRYGARRRQFGPAGEPETPLLDYLTHRLRLLPRLATTYALTFAVGELVERYADSKEADRRQVETAAAGLKAYATWHATDVIQTCRECCGGQGYLAVNRFAALKADSDVFTTFEGDNTVLLQLVTKSLLGGYKQHFGELRMFGLVRHLAGLAGTALAELNPVVTRLTDEGHLRGREFQRAAFAWREQHLLAALARRLKKRIDSGMDSFAALVQCQDHAVTLAKAHVERTVLERFAATVEAVADASLAAALTPLLDLYALHRIHVDRGWFLSHGYIEPGKSKAIRNLVNRICGELRPQAVPLVDAFGIPQELLGAPIAMSDA